MSHKITIEGGTSVRLPTKGKYCDRDIVITAEGNTADHDVYDGEYEITPTVSAQMLPVAQKLMRKDLTVKAIPIFNVSNTAGGSTFYIATMDGEPDGGMAILGKSKLGAMAL